MENTHEEIKYGSNKWIDAFFDPTTCIQTISQCMILSDIYKNDDYKLIVADYGELILNDDSDPSNVEMAQEAGGDMKKQLNNKVKLKVFKGLTMVSEVGISDIPSSIAMVTVDNLVPNIPALAISCNSCVYIYKNMKPYFKFALPTSHLCEEEKKAWVDFKNEHITVSELVVALDNIRGFGRMNELTQKSLKFLELSNNEERIKFIHNYKDVPLVKNTCITVMTSLMKSSQDDDGIRCIVVGCEDGNIHIINPETFSVAVSYTLASVPVFMVSQGLYDVEYSIYCACRNGAVYGIKRDIDKPREFFRVMSHVVGLVKMGKMLVVGCMDASLHCYNTKGTCLWTVTCHGSIQCMELMDLKMKNLQLLLVSIIPQQQHHHHHASPDITSSSSSPPPSSSSSCGQILMYLDKTLVDVMLIEDVVTSMKFGRYGRELDTLVMITRCGGLMIKVLKRTTNFEDQGGIKSIESLKTSDYKLEIPKKTKLFLDQTSRERECAVVMHHKFQQDLCRLKLLTGQSYIQMLDKQLNVVSMEIDSPVKLNVEVNGLGPTFKMNISVQNTSLNKSCHHYFITFLYDQCFYRIKDHIINLPMITPGLIFTTSIFIHCNNDKSIADVIKVMLCMEKTNSPILTAVVNMPVSEGNMNFA